MKFEELIEVGVYTSPLALLSIKDAKVVDKINNYLPYSIGIEIECMKSPEFNLENFTSIPDIMDVKIDSEEQRFRIPNGLVGLICLYNICERLKINSELNPESGHHYHIDMTHTYDMLSNEFIKSNEDWILRELDTWEYGGTYNRRQIEFNCSHNWMRFQSDFKTAEIRIGNMTFDYDIIVRRLIHACQIIRKLNYKLVNQELLVFGKPDIHLLQSQVINAKYKSKMDYLMKQLASLEEDSNNEVQSTEEQRKQVIKNRVIKIK